MKNLQIGPTLAQQLDRLDTKVKDLSFVGVDPNSLLKAPVVAVVGTRKPTPYGKQVTEKLVTELVRAGVTIVSGLAFGVDILAHKTALDEDGITISVLPSGLGNIYPASHQGVAKKILSKGCLISEYSPKHMPRKKEFLERNRIIAALSDIVVIPEAAERSGSLNTASHARSMGIKVCAVPGNITSTMSKGTNMLIKNSEATPITSAEDILNLLNVKKKATKRTGKNNKQTEVLKKISEGLNDSTQLQLELGIKTSQFLTQMTMLEIDGKVYQDEIGNWHLK